MKYFSIKTDISTSLNLRKYEYYLIKKKRFFKIFIVYVKHLSYFYFQDTSTGKVSNIIYGYYLKSLNII